jgi:hypothetical protein
MSMSKDRVRFTLAGYYFEGSHESMGLVLREAFGMSERDLVGVETTAKETGGVIIQCRPSQFARFLILRDRVGYQNMFKELRAELIVPKPIPQIVDCSRNPATN